MSIHEIAGSLAFKTFNLLAFSHDSITSIVRQLKTSFEIHFKPSKKLFVRADATRARLMLEFFLGCSNCDVDIQKELLHKTALRPVVCLCVKRDKCTGQQTRGSNTQEICIFPRTKASNRGEERCCLGCWLNIFSFGVEKSESNESRHGPSRDMGEKGNSGMTVENQTSL